MIRRKRRIESRVRKLHCELLEDRRMLAPVAVSTTSDVVDGNVASISLLISNPGPDGKISLREAIAAANQAQDHDTITFDPAVFNTPQTILLTQGELTITQSVTIDGTVDGVGPSQELLDITIDAGGNSRIFHIYNTSLTGTITLAGMTLTGGYTSYSGGAIFLGPGHATSSQDATKLVLDTMTITGNEASNGGGIAVRETNRFTLEIRNSTITGNSATSGGGIFSNAKYVLLTNSTVLDNHVSSNFGKGGGLRSADLAMAV